MRAEKLPRRTFVKLMVAAGSAAAGVAGGLMPSVVQGAMAERMVRVEDMNLRSMSCGWGVPHKNRSISGKALKVGTTEYRHGIGTHAASVFGIELHGEAVKFTAKVGVDSEVGKAGAVIFELVGDGHLLAKSPVMHGGGGAVELQANLTGIKILDLVVRAAGAGNILNHADWIDPIIIIKAGATNIPTPAISAAGGPMPILAHGDPDTPEFHGARVVGASPGKPFMFRVPYTGVGEVELSAEGLPAGLTLHDGVISGTVATAGTYRVKLTAKNKHGTAKRTLRIMIGEEMIGRTPAMGWNSWNAYGGGNSAARTKAAADAFIRLGLAAKGYTYINIDDCWQAGRAANGEIQTTALFGDMKDLADYIHGKGLKFGVYSSPGPKTCGRHTGSYGHVTQDAQTYARWGVDYLKYDWCSYGMIDRRPDLEGYIKPYRQMGEALRSTDRDIFFSLCQYGMGHVWTWAGKAPVYGNSYRISGDINDSWGSLCNNGFRADGDLYPFAGPGHWNDPDMLVVGWGSFEDGPLHWSKLTPNEQVTHISLWCLLAAPLLLGCDLNHMNTFTLDLISNTEVLAVNQDELGVQAQCVSRRGDREVWARPLFDGTVAVGLFNRGMLLEKIGITWPELWPVLPRGRSLKSRHPVRDLWQRKDLGLHDGFSATVNPHGAVMLKVGTPLDVD